MEQKHFKDDLVILKKFTINENDLLVNAFGRFSGKIQLKAKGSKKILSKFTGRLEPMSIIQAEIYNSGRSFTLTNANLKICPSIDTSLANFNLSQKICYTLNKLLPFEEPNPSLFSLIESVGQAIINKEPESKTEIFFLTKFLDLAGLLPSFMFCNHCHQKFEQNPYLDECQLVCSKCLQQEKINDYAEVELNTVKLINYINCTSRVQQLRPLKIPTQNNFEANKILEKLINFTHA
jgi:DNA repair protein RecO